MHLLFRKIQAAFMWARTVVPMEKRNVFVVYLIVLLATCLDNINSTSSLTMAADIQNAFNTDSSTVSWVLSGYALTLGSFIMIAGKIADIIGPHNLYLIGLTIVWICALICACIPQTSIIVLIVFRAIQGIGASALVPSTLALAANYFSGEYSKYLIYAVMGFIISVTGTLGLGLVLGGAFAETSIGYRSFFYFVFAMGLVCNTLLLFLIIPIKKTKAHSMLKMKNINFISASLAISGVLLMILGLTEGSNDWRVPKAYVPLVVGFFTCAASLAFETLYITRFQKTRSTSDPQSDWRLQMDLLFPPELLKIPNFLLFLVVSGIYYATLVMMFALGVQYYTFIENEIPIVVAIKVFPLTCGLVFGACIYKPGYYKKIGLRNMFILSAAITLGTCIWYSRTNFKVHNSYWKFGFVSLFLYGYGMNIFFNIYLSVVIENTPLHLQGVVNGIYQTCSQVLLSIGNALIPSILGNIEISRNDQMREILDKKFQNVFYVVMGFHVFVLILMVLFVRKTNHEDIETIEVAALEI